LYVLSKSHSIFWFSSFFCRRFVQIRVCLLFFFIFGLLGAQGVIFLFWERMVVGAYSRSFCLRVFVLFFVVSRKRIFFGSVIDFLFEVAIFSHFIFRRWVFFLFLFFCF